MKKFIVFAVLMGFVGYGLADMGTQTINNRAAQLVALEAGV